MGCVGCIFDFAMSNASWYAFCESSTTAAMQTGKSRLQFLQIYSQERDLSLFCRDTYVKGIINRNKVERGKEHEQPFRVIFHGIQLLQCSWTYVLYGRENKRNHQSTNTENKSAFSFLFHKNRVLYIFASTASTPSFFASSLSRLLYLVSIFVVSTLVSLWIIPVWPAGRPCLESWGSRNRKRRSWGRDLAWLGG